MFKQRFFFAAIVSPIFSIAALSFDYDLAVVGPLCFADGIGRQAIGIIDCLASDVRVKFIPSRFASTITLQDLPDRVQESIVHQKTGTVGVALLEDLITCGKTKAYRRMPKCHIKLAYTMVESNHVSPEWVGILNEHFDAALVPDPFLLKVYADAGVGIPIFVLPLGLYINELLALHEKEKSTPFVFGFSGTFTARKNHMGLLEAFFKAFGNDPAYRLRLHGRSNQGTLAHLEQRIGQLGLKNVELINTVFSWAQYKEFLQSLDCYVSLSQGEGYSLTPREALALGIPCILSNNTAHASIIQTGFAYGVCDQHEAVCAFEKMVTDFEVQKIAARAARGWVREFTYDNLRRLYLTIVRPEQVVLSDENIIKPGCLTTNSPELFKKYQQLIGMLPL